MLLKRWILFSIIGLSSVVVRAQTLVVVDIDDTLKVAHVLNAADSIANSGKIKNQFLGMAKLLRMFKEDNSEMAIAYVSNAPESLMHNSHRRFIEINGFPDDGFLLLRENVFDGSFKVRVIRQLVNEIMPAKVILIGDNAEKDTLIYEQIQKDFPQIPILTLIHRVYSVKNKKDTGKPLQKDQMGYVTSVDLAVIFSRLNMISRDHFQQFLNEEIPRIVAEPDHLEEGEIAFPKWMDCRDQMVRRFKMPGQKDLFAQYQSRLKKRCTR